MPRPHGGEKGVRVEREGHEAIPGVVLADLVLVEPHFLFARLDALLDCPALPGDADQGVERRAPRALGAVNRGPAPRGVRRPALRARSLGRVPQATAGARDHYRTPRRP